MMSWENIFHRSFTSSRIRRYGLTTFASKWKWRFISRQCSKHLISVKLCKENRLCNLRVTFPSFQRASKRANISQVMAMKESFWLYAKTSNTKLFHSTTFDIHSISRWKTMKNITLVLMISPHSALFWCRIRCWTGIFYANIFICTEHRAHRKLLWAHDENFKK